MRVILFDYRLTMDHCRCFSNEISNDCFRIVVEFFQCLKEEISCQFSEFQVFILFSLNFKYLIIH